MVATTDGVVYGRVVDVRPGPSLTTPSPAEGRDIEIPTQRVAVETIETLSGHLPRTVHVFRTGSSRFVVDGDPPYVIGATYVFFLRAFSEEEPGTYAPISPDGRLQEGADNRFRAPIDGGVADDLSGKSRSEIKQASESAELTP